MITGKQKVVCVVWAPSSSRMDGFSAELGAKKFYLSFYYGPRYLAPVRYFVLFFWTGILLLINDPNVILAQNPPIFCPLTCLIYASLFRKKVVIDHHAVWSIKTFGSSPLRKPLAWLEEIASRSACANTTPHQYWSLEFEKMGARNVLTVFDFVESLNSSPNSIYREKYLDKNAKFLVLAPHGGHELERIESEIEAAHKVSDITLLITGPPSKLSTRLGRITLSPNVHYLGFLPLSEYSKILDSIDIGMNISDEPFTISHSLLQFASRSTPTISTRQKAVEDLFGDSLYYVTSSSKEDVAVGLLELTSSSALMQEFRKRIANKQQQLKVKRKEALHLLSETLGSLNK